MTPCRYSLLLDAIAGLVGEAPHGVSPCEQPARYRTRVARGSYDEGIQATVAAELCDQHDHEARSDPGYSGSWVLRREPFPSNRCDMGPRPGCARPPGHDGLCSSLPPTT